MEFKFHDDKNKYKDNNILINKEYTKFESFIKDIIIVIFEDKKIEEKKQNSLNISNINASDSK